jgi:hypothetical protein
VARPIALIRAYVLLQRLRRRAPRERELGCQAGGQASAVVQGTGGPRLLRPSIEGVDARARFLHLTVAGSAALVLPRPVVPRLETGPQLSNTRQKKLRQWWNKPPELPGVRRTLDRLESIPSISLPRANYRGVKARGGTFFFGVKNRSSGCASLAADRFRMPARHGDASNKAYPSIIRTGMNSTQSARSKTTSNGSISWHASASAACL